jgi:hypothetical protein
MKLKSFKEFLNEFEIEGEHHKLYTIKGKVTLTAFINDYENEDSDEVFGEGIFDYFSDFRDLIKDHSVLGSLDIVSVDIDIKYDEHGTITIKTKSSLDKINSVMSQHKTIEIDEEMEDPTPDDPMTNLYLTIYDMEVK